MAFMLGSFTDGMFGSLKDMAALTNAWEDLKQKKLENEYRKDALEAVKKGQAATAAAGGGVAPQIVDAKGDRPSPDPYMTGGNATSPAPPDDLSKWKPKALLPPPSPENPSEGKSAIPAGGTPTKTTIPSGAYVSPAGPPAGSDADEPWAGTYTGQPVPYTGPPTPELGQAPAALPGVNRGWPAPGPSAGPAPGTDRGRLRTPVAPPPAQLLPSQPPAPPRPVASSPIGGMTGIDYGRAAAPPVQQDTALDLVGGQLGDPRVAPAPSLGAQILNVLRFR
jgi:hypothetical protein